MHIYYIDDNLISPPGGKTLGGQGPDIPPSGFFYTRTK